MPKFKFIVFNLFIHVLCLTSCEAWADDNTWNPCPDALSAKQAAPSEADRSASDAKPWELLLSPYAYHWRYNPEHRPVFLGAMERHVAGNRFCGLALFRNSFGQPSAYLYVGKQWNGVFDTPHLFVKVSAGFIDGYRGKYQEKIPFNDYGIAPAIIPSLGYRFSPHDSAQVMVLGTAGLLFAYAHDF